MTTFVDYETTNLHSLTIRVRLNSAGASQEGLDPKFQLARTKRFPQIVVSACFVAGHFIIERVVCGQEKRWGLHASLPDALQQVEAGHSGHRNIEDETVKLTAGCGFQGSRAA